MQPIPLGVTPDADAKPDAVHIAIYPGIAAHGLSPGEDVGFTDDSRERVGESDVPFGIIDPFCKRPISEGDRCWVLLYPNTVTSLRHDWTHPAFADNPSLALAECRLNEIASEIGVDADELKENAEWWMNDKSKWPEYWVEGARFDGVCLPDDFWDAYEAATGAKCPENRRHSFLGCSC